MQDWCGYAMARRGPRIEYSSLFKCLLVVNIVMLSGAVVTPSLGSSPQSRRGLSLYDHLLPIPRPPLPFFPLQIVSASFFYRIDDEFFFRTT